MKSHATRLMVNTYYHFWEASTI